MKPQRIPWDQGGKDAIVSGEKMENKPCCSHAERINCKKMYELGSLKILIADLLLQYYSKMKMSFCTCELCLCWSSRSTWREQERGQSQWLRRGGWWRDPWADWSQGLGDDGGRALGGQEPWQPEEKREGGASSTAAGERSRRLEHNKPARYFYLMLS